MSYYKINESLNSSCLYIRGINITTNKVGFSEASNNILSWNTITGERPRRCSMLLGNHNNIRRLIILFISKHI